MYVYTVILSLLVFFANGQINRPGGCPKIRTQRGFDINQYIGRWYEIEKFFFIPEIGLKCNQAFYIPNSNGQVTVVNSGIEKRNGMVRQVRGTATPDPREPGKISVTFSPFQPPIPNYLVLDTDYKTYSLVYSCNINGSQAFESAFLLARHPFRLSQNIRQRLYENLRKTGINPENFIPTDQSGCQPIPPNLPRQMGDQGMRQVLLPGMREGYSLGIGQRTTGMFISRPSRVVTLHLNVHSNFKPTMYGK